MPEVMREVLGNKADETGAADAGADFEGMNSGCAPSGRVEPVEVDVAVSPDGIEVAPVTIQEISRRGFADLAEGPRELLKAQLFEEIDSNAAEHVVNGVLVRASDARIGQVNQRTARESLVWYGSHPEYYQAMLGDRVLLRKDVLELEDSCHACHGKGFTEEFCGTCHGSGYSEVDGVGQHSCSDCEVLGYDIERRWSCGRARCGVCYGSGWRAGVVIPEVAERKPITGIVVSLGPACQLLKLGDRVLHSRFAGHEITVAEKETYVMMREPEALSILRHRNGMH